jgi:hypothetical protein
MWFIIIIIIIIIISDFRAQTECITDHPNYWSSAQNFLKNQFCHHSISYVSANDYVKFYNYHLHLDHSTKHINRRFSVIRSPPLLCINSFIRITWNYLRMAL